MSQAIISHWFFQVLSRFSYEPHLDVIKYVKATIPKTPIVGSVLDKIFFSYMKHIAVVAFKNWFHFHLTDIALRDKNISDQTEVSSI